jgi:pimeloyl-ACP methyl ester carboxylesterase
MTDNGLCWTPVAKALEADYDLIMVDARGHGFSDATPEGYDPKTQVDDLARFIQALKLEKPVVMGHSMGASTAFLAVAAYPGLARAAILEDPPFREPSPESNEEQRGAFPSRVRKENQEHKAMSRQALMEHKHKESPTWPADELGPWADSKQQVSLAFMDAIQIRPPIGSPWEVLAKITCPVLLVTADPEKGAIVTPESAQKAARMQPLLEVANIPGAGHNIRRENFPAYMKAVREFLKRV